MVEFEYLESKNDIARYEQAKNVFKTITTPFAFDKAQEIINKHNAYHKIVEFVKASKDKTSKEGINGTIWYIPFKCIGLSLDTDKGYFIDDKATLVVEPFANMDEVFHVIYIIGQVGCLNYWVENNINLLTEILENQDKIETICKDLNEINKIRSL